MITTNHFQQAFAHRQVDPNVVGQHNARLGNKVKKTTRPLKLALSDIIPQKKGKPQDQRVMQQAPVQEEHILSNLGQWLANLPVVGTIFGLLGKSPN